MRFFFLDYCALLLNKNQNQNQSFENSKRKRENLIAVEAAEVAKVNEVRKLFGIRKEKKFRIGKE